MNYTEIALLFFDKASFFIYGIICGYVVHFFENETMTRRNLQKILTFGFLTMFANVVVTGYYKEIKNENVIITVTMIVACGIYFIWLNIFTKNWKKQIGRMLIWFLAKKAGFEVKEKENIEKIYIPKEK